MRTTTTTTRTRTTRTTTTRTSTTSPTRPAELETLGGAAAISSSPPVREARGPAPPSDPRSWVAVRAPTIAEAHPAAWHPGERDLQRRALESRRPRWPRPRRSSPTPRPSVGALTSSSALRSSSGSTRSCAAIEARSWVAVRAPTIADATPRPCTHASATSSGVRSRPVGRGRHRLDDRRRRPREVGLDEAREVRRRRPGVGRDGPAVLAGQHAAPQRGPREHADAERDGRGDHLALDPALQQRVLGLDRGEPDLALEQARRAGHLPAGVVGQPDVAGAPAGDGEPQRGHRLVERGARVGRLDEPQVDVVGPQAPQGAVQRRQEPAARGVHDPAVAGAPDAGLRAQHDLVARDDVAEQLDRGAPRRRRRRRRRTCPPACRRRR